MVNAQLYSNLAVLDNSFYIISNTDEGLSIGVSFSIQNTSEIITLTLPSASGTIALTGGAASSLPADNITPGDSSVYITTTAGGTSLNTNQGVSLILNYDGTPEVSLGLSTMKLKENEGYTITHTSNAAAEDLTISQAGAVDASLVLSSAGTGVDALKFDATAGGIDINSGTGGFTVDSTGAISIDCTGTGVATNLNHVGAAGQDLTVACTAGSLNLTAGEADGAAVRIHASDTAGGISINAGTGGIDISTTGTFTLQSTDTASDSVLVESTLGGIDIRASNGTSAVKVQKSTRYFQIEYTTDATTDVQAIRTLDNLVVAGTSSSHYVHADFTVVNGVSALVGGYGITGVYYYNKSTLALHNVTSHTSVGDTTNDNNGTGTIGNTTISISGTDLAVNYEPTSTVVVNVEGLITVTTAEVT